MPLRQATFVVIVVTRKKMPFSKKHKYRTPMTKCRAAEHQATDL